MVKVFWSCWSNNQAIGQRGTETVRTSLASLLGPMQKFLPVSPRFLEPKSWQIAVSRLQCQTPYPITPTITCFLSLDAPAPASAALTHYRLLVRVVFWSEPASVASTRSVLKWLQNWSIIASPSLWMTLVHNWAFGASDGIKSNIISITMFTSYITHLSFVYSPFQSIPPSIACFFTFDWFPPAHAIYVWLLLCQRC